MIDFWGYPHKPGLNDVVVAKSLFPSFTQAKICWPPYCQWISKSTNRNPHIGLVRLELHYRVNPLLELNSLKDIMDSFSRNVDFLNNKFGRIFVVFSTMNSLIKDLDISSQTNWKNVFSSLLSMKVTFKVNCMYL